MPVAVFLALILWRLNEIGVAVVIANAPRSPWYYCLSLALFLTPLAIDTVVFKSVWRVNASRLAHALARRRALNNFSPGRFGDAYLARWGAGSLGRASAGYVHGIREINIAAFFVGIATAILLTSLVLVPVTEGVIRLLLIGCVALGIIVIAVAYTVRSVVLAMNGRPLWRVVALTAASHVVMIALHVASWAVVMPQTPPIAWLTLFAAGFLVSQILAQPNLSLIILGAGLLLAPSLGLPTAALAGLLATGAAISFLAYLLVIFLTSPSRVPPAPPRRDAAPHSETVVRFQGL